jgi:hypothetical protein
MPLINKQYVDFNPEKLADAISAGLPVEPDRFDYEDQKQFLQRTQKEYEQISEILKKKDPKAWKKWHGIAEPENLSPFNEWNKLPMRNPGALANLLGGGQNTAANLLVRESNKLRG